MSCFDLKDINSELNRVKNAIYKLPLNYGSIDLSSKFMKDRQIAKKIMKAKFPKKGRSETEIDDDLNRIVYGIDIRKRLGQSYKPYISEAEFEDDADQRADNLEVSEDGFVPILRDNPIFDDIALLKSEIRIAAFQLGEKGQSLVKDIVSLTSLLASSLPTMAALIVTIPIPNISGALSILLIVLKAIEDFFNKIKDILPYLDILSKLELVIGPIYFDTIQSILCNYLKILADVLSKLNQLSAPLSALLKGKTPSERITDVNNAKTAVETAQKNLNEVGWFKTIDETGVSVTGDTNTRGGDAPAVYKSDYGDGWILNSKKNLYTTNKFGSRPPKEIDSLWKADLESKWKDYTDAINKAKKLAS